jgi:hypothetical protein
MPVLCGIGCGSTSHRVDFRSVVADVKAAGNGAILVATHDLRPLSPEEGAAYAGESRTAAGARIRVYTSTKNPFADDVSHAVAASLAYGGFRTREVRTRLGAKRDAVLAALAGAETALLLTVRQWKSFTLYPGTSLRFDLTLEVLRPGEVAASASTRGQEAIGKGWTNPLEAISTKTPTAFKAKLERLLNDPQVVAALNASAKPAESGKGKGAGEFNPLD